MTTDPKERGEGEPSPLEPDAALDALFDAARAPAAPSDALLARVLADAAAVQAEIAPQAPGPSHDPAAGPELTGSVWAEIRAGLGGWLGLGGLAAAGLAGLTLGVALPGELDALAGGQISAALGAADLTAAIELEAIGFAMEASEP